MKKKVIALVVALIMIFALVPTTAFAAGGSYSYPSNGNGGRINVSSADEAMGLINPAQSYSNFDDNGGNSCDTWTFTAEAAPGFAFDKWDISGGDYVSNLSCGSKTLSITYKPGPDGTGSDENHSFSAVASFKAVHTVTYAANGAKVGTVPEDNGSYGAGESVTVRDNTGGLKIPGFDFVGWELDGTVYAPGSVFTMGDSNVTLSAKWAKLFEVKFFSGFGAPVKQYVRDGSTAAKPADPTKPNHAFLGWFYNDSEWNFDNAVTSDMELQARWAKQYKVWFQSNGGSAVSSQTVVDGGKATEPTAPTRKGYKFDGWYFEDSEWNFDTNTVAKDITLCARWTKLYTVAFDSDHGSPVESQSVPSGGKATKPADPTRDGYRFDGWYICGQGWNFDTDTVIKDITLRACWTKLYTVSFDSEHGSPVESQTVPSGGKATQPANPTRDGYRFDGWYYCNKEWNFDTNTVTKDITLHACWTKLYTVSFDSEHGSSVESQTVPSGGKATQPADPTRTGFKFDGWYYGIVKWDFDTYMVFKDITLHACWIKEHTVSFDSNHGSPVDSQTVLNGRKATQPADPTRAGYKFDGWYTTVCGHQSEWKFDVFRVFDDVTLVAKWIPISYTVTYNKTTGDGGSTADSVHTYDVEAVLTQNGYYKTGYTFAGWTDLPEGTSAKYTDGQSVLNLTTLDGDVVEMYAIWKINTYAVKFVDFDGKVLNTQSVNYGSPATAPANPTREGYTFTGWDKAYDKITSDLTVTAQYKINTYTVKFVNFDGTVLNTQSVNYGSPATAPANPTRDGYTFTGWDKAYDKIISDLTVTAQYKINAYTVKFVDFDGKVLSTQSVNWGTAAAAPANPARSGYTFTGWDKDYSKITSDLTVTAQYKQNVSSSDEDIPGTYDSGSQPFPWLWIAVAAVLASAIVVIVVSQAKRHKKTGDTV